MIQEKPIPCDHWSDCGLRGGGCCAIDEYDGPSFGVCATCLTIRGERPEGWYGPEQARRAIEALEKSQSPIWVLNRKYKCDRCDNKQCMLQHMSPCERMGRLKRPAMSCPIALWFPVDLTTGEEVLPC